MTSGAFACRSGGPDPDPPGLPSGPRSGGVRSTARGGLSVWFSANLCRCPGPVSGRGTGSVPTKQDDLARSRGGRSLPGEGQEAAAAQPVPDPRISGFCRHRVGVGVWRAGRAGGTSPCCSVAGGGGGRPCRRGASPGSASRGGRCRYQSPDCRAIAGGCSCRCRSAPFFGNARGDEVRPLPGGGGVLKIEALSPCQVQVVIDARPPHVYSLSAGAVINWLVENGLHLTMVEPGRLRCWLDGRPLTVLDRRGLALQSTGGKD
jgi:hypothetical protein